jgi:glucose/arabinose dehydrogenase
MKFLPAGLAVLLSSSDIRAQAPTVEDPNLAVRTVVSGLTTPTTMAFIGSNDILVLEKSTGQVKRVVNGVVQSVVLDLAVNNFSERGLLGIALHPKFPKDRGVYLYWTCRSLTNTPDPFIPEQKRCADTNMFGADTSDAAAVPLLGNRVDRFVWNGSALLFEKNLIILRAFQHDTGQALRGNHNGGVIAFAPEEDENEQEAEDKNGQHKARGQDERGDDRDEHKSKLFIVIGDNGRRGQLQNLPQGPFGPNQADDQFGGPQPDDAHLTGVILRLNDDGTTPGDNPFFRVGAQMAGEVGANIQKIFAYGVRNTFGMAFDPKSGQLWMEQNGDDSFDEIDRVEAGFNGGWVQIMGPVSRIAQFKQIETSSQFFGLQQIRWSPTLIADTPQEALSRLFMLPGARYTDPLFSWKFSVTPAAIGFLDSNKLGGQYQGDLFVGAATANTFGGHLFRFRLTGNGRNLVFTDPRLLDGVADNAAKHDITESESLLFGRNFGIGTDIKTGPNGNLFVVSLTKGTIFEIYRVH